MHIEVQDVSTPNPPNRWEAGVGLQLSPLERGLCLFQDGLGGTSGLDEVLPLGSLEILGDPNLPWSFPQLKEHPEKGVYVKGLSMHTVHSVAQCERVMETGWKNRAVGYTLMNKDSSRSHSIFTISIEIYAVGTGLAVGRGWPAYAEPGSHFCQEGVSPLRSPENPMANWEKMTLTT